MLSDERDYSTIKKKRKHYSSDEDFQVAQLKRFFYKKFFKLVDAIDFENDTDSQKKISELKNLYDYCKSNASIEIEHINDKIREEQYSRHPNISVINEYKNIIEKYKNLAGEIDDDFEQLFDNYMGKKVDALHNDAHDIDIDDIDGEYETEFMSKHGTYRWTEVIQSRFNNEFCRVTDITPKDENGMNKGNNLIFKVTNPLTGKHKILRTLNFHEDVVNEANLYDNALNQLPDSTKDTYFPDYQTQRLGKDTGGNVYFIEYSDFVEQDLSNCINNSIDPAHDALKYVVQLLDFSDTLKEAHVLYPDIKPTNIRVNSNNRIIMSDFKTLMHYDVDDTSLSESNSVEKPQLCSANDIAVSRLFSHDNCMVDDEYLNIDIHMRISIGLTVYNMLTGLHFEEVDEDMRFKDEIFTSDSGKYLRDLILRAVNPDSDAIFSPSEEANNLRPFIHNISNEKWRNRIKSANEAEQPMIVRELYHYRMSNSIANEVNELASLYPNAENQLCLLADEIREFAGVVDPIDIINQFYSNDRTGELQTAVDESNLYGYVNKYTDVIRDLDINKSNFREMYMHATYNTEKRPISTMNHHTFNDTIISTNNRSLRKLDEKSLVKPKKRKRRRNITAEERQKNVSSRISRGKKIKRVIVEENRATNDAGDTKSHRQKKKKIDQSTIKPSSKSAESTSSSPRPGQSSSSTG